MGRKGLPRKDLASSVEEGHLAEERGQRAGVCRVRAALGSLWYGSGSRDIAVAKTAQGRDVWRGPEGDRGEDRYS